LLEAASEIEGLERIRFTSPHPKGYGDDLVEAFARLPKLCPHAHLPLQSGSDRILKAMHRGYTRRTLSSTSSASCGRHVPRIGFHRPHRRFPGETEADFEATLALVREVEFDQAYIFKYSPRRDTKAASMPDQVPEEVRDERNQRLLAVVNEIGDRKYRQLVDQTVEVLVEGPSRKNRARLEGRTGCNKIVILEGDHRHIGELMHIRVVRHGSFTLYGDPAILGMEGDEPLLPSSQ
jgi:tRNA-2-methylthio-N6-dimethylallyladenosine synthase